MPILSVYPLLKMGLNEFKFDPNSTENEGRWRLVDPMVFDQNTIRRWRTWKGIRTPGVQYVVGMDTRDKKWKPQAVRFKLNGSVDETFTEEKAAGWWNEYKNDFEKEWQQENWDEWIAKHPKEVAPYYKMADRQSDVDALFAGDMSQAEYDTLYPSIEEEKELPPTYNTYQCAWCERYFDKETREYVNKPIDASVVSHGVCSECSRRLLKEDLLEIE